MNLLMKHLSSFKIKAIIVMLSVIVPVTVSARDYSSWMSELPDEAYITTLSIPGTHDSATGNGFAGSAASLWDMFSKTQDHTVEQQMEMGVRAFDFRPGNQDGRLRCYHGMSEINYWFDDAIRDICKFLDTHPDEFFFIHLYKATDDLNKGVTDLLTELIETEDVAPHVARFSPDLTVADMRGKILFMPRSDINWSSDMVACLFDWAETGWETREQFVKNYKADRRGRIVMQDLANTDADKKIEQVVKLLDFTTSYSPAHSRDMVWAMNFASSYAGSISTSASYCENASKVNLAIIDYLGCVFGPTGIVLADWVGDNDHVLGGNTYNTQGESLVRAIIDNNFTYLPMIYDKADTSLWTETALDNMISPKLYHGITSWMDCDSDGLPDLVVKGRDQNSGKKPGFYVMKNNGSSLGSVSAVPFPESSGSDNENRNRIMIPVDYNADGHVDMLYGCASGTFLLANDGNGNFAEPLDGDGNRLFSLGDTEMNFDRSGENVMETRGVAGLMLAADLDMDGYPDIVTFSAGTSGVNGVPVIYRNECGSATGRFSQAECDLPQLTQGTIAVGDYDGDGCPDLLVSGVSGATRQVCICLNRGFVDGKFHFETLIPEELQSSATDRGIVGFVDIDNDGLLDIFVSGRLRAYSDRTSYTASLFHHCQDGSLKKVYTPALPVCHSGMDWADIDGDGFVDIIYGGTAKIFNGVENRRVTYETASTSVLFNRGDGTFYRDNMMLAPLRAGVSVSVADYNGAGRASIAMMGSGEDNTFYLYEPAEKCDETIPGEITPEIDDTVDCKVTLSWSPVGGGLRYNYVVETTDGHLFSAVPVDVATGRLRAADVNAATTATAVTLNIDGKKVKRYGVQAISQSKRGGVLKMTWLNGDSGVGTIEADAENAPVTYFNLQGQHVANPSGGIFIECRGGNAVKRYIP